MRVLIVIGTRPEAIKMAPLITALRESPSVEVKVCLTAQHRQMVDPILEMFQIVPDYDLDIMQVGQSLSGLTGTMISKMEPIVKECQPDIVLVQGDTSTTLVAALAAHYQQVEIGHVEAGLRTGNLWSPWPEEANRRVTSVLAKYHFAPTLRARENLLREGISSAKIHVTGNTVIDALMTTVGRLRDDAVLRKQVKDRFGFVDPKKRLVLVTSHRRESFGAGLNSVCQALREIAGRGDTQVIFPVHLNPRVQTPVRGMLTNVPGIFLLDPQEYLPFVYLMDRAALIVSDSGGIQEEAPALGKPVLVTRDVTERPEAVEAGTAKTVGTDRNTIVLEANRLLDDSSAYLAMAQARNPYGDGSAALRIRDILVQECSTAFQ